MTALTTMATSRDFLLIGDSKLVSCGNLAAMTEAGVAFLAPASKTHVPAAVLATLDIHTAVEVDHVAERDRGKPATRRGRWRVIEDTMTLAGPRKKDPVLTLRRVFVHSTARAQAAVTARERKLAQARDDLERLQRGLGSRHYPDAASVTARVAAISRARRVSTYLRTTVSTEAATGKPALAWTFDQQALAAEAALDGWHALLTNLDPAHADAPEVLRRYKGQETVERRYSAVKGPLAVAPLFLKNNRRIAALIAVICLALLIFCLIERQTRLALAPQTTLEGLYAGRPANPPAG
ncbi:hypothetical protein [Amycolatopsis sp. DG1A-15b]|uniref:IS1634 family transposase n=1 Tax=Amycolatopsis sp. DG1A-15b TaxID=3052846 RepID=UPI00255C09F4|nr:hypothetical protein [Amycolatopsis sp. DG1A-15b]WIX89237.1 hypothetical protein QRY02_01955 [Amycolatopsis sp. DG1A-15b]